MSKSRQAMDVTAGERVGGVRGALHDTWWRFWSSEVRCPMPNLERCRERAEECRRRAEAVSHPRDRAQWVKLAEDWIALSQIPFQPDPTVDTTRVARSGLWRANF
jgi:hypothetical protein